MGPMGRRQLGALRIAAVFAAAAALSILMFGCGSDSSGTGRSAAQSDPTGFDSISEQAFDGESLSGGDIVMTLAGSRDTFVLKGEEYIEPGCMAVQKSRGDITDDVTIEGTVDADTPGSYQITYTAKAPDGSSAETVRNVHVVESFDGNAESIPVLMYHYVYNEADPPDEINGNYILDTDLAEQCEYLVEEGYYFPSFEELAAFVEGDHTLPAKSVILTFDDGEQGFLDTGIPVLEEYGVPATSFLIGVDGLERALDYASEYVQFQSHSYGMHRAGGGAGQGGIIHAMDEEEVYEDAVAFNDLLGRDAVALAYPFGDNHEDAWKGLEEAGIVCAFTVVNDRISPGDNLMALNRVRISGEYSIDGFIASVEP